TERSEREEILVDDDVARSCRAAIGEHADLRRHRVAELDRAGIERGFDARRGSWRYGARAAAARDHDRDGGPGPPEGAGGDPDRRRVRGPHLARRLSRLTAAHSRKARSIS